MVFNKRRNKYIFYSQRNWNIRVKGISECDDDTVEYYSSEIPISICPVDFDNDGIIDNIDLDHDNDGILNSVESEELEILISQIQHHQP